jgi:hypothetical protein
MSAKSKSTARSASTYRGARRNVGRGSRAAQLKRHRKLLGLSRSDYDRWRAGKAQKTV